MLFNTFSFIIFNFIAVAFFWTSRTKFFRNLVLVSSSLIFYMWHYWPSIFILLSLLIFNFYTAKKIEESKNSKTILKFGVIINLLTLIYFKYSIFLLESLISFFNIFGLEIKIPSPSQWLPLGISFYVFQIIGYLVDVSRKEIPAERNFIQFAIFKSFYAQLIAGPIVRAKDFLPQLKAFNKFDPKKFHLGLYYIIGGLFIKIVIADTISQFVDYGFLNPQNLNLTNAWVTMYGFSIQILSDFWGYSTIAMGVGLLYSIELPINFKAPYLSSSLREFWRRWHITLSYWLRDYLYISLGGNRKSHLRNLFLTMAIGGLWHGASWNFLIWGAGHGLWLVVEHLIRQSSLEIKVPKFLKVFFVFNCVSLLWVFFRATNFSNAFLYFQALLGNFESEVEFSSTLINQMLMFIGFCFILGNSMIDKSFLKWSTKRQVLTSCTLLLLILSFASSKLDFIYFVF